MNLGWVRSQQSIIKEFLDVLSMPKMRGKSLIQSPDLGYGSETKGYHLYDPKRKRVFFSRYVLFSESNVGIEKELSELNERQCVELDGFSEEETVSESEPELQGSGRESRPPNHDGE